MIEYLLSSFRTPETSFQLLELRQKSQIYKVNGVKGQQQSFLEFNVFHLNSFVYDIGKAIPKPSHFKARADFARRQNRISKITASSAANFGS